MIRYPYGWVWNRSKPALADTAAIPAVARVPVVATRATSTAKARATVALGTRRAPGPAPPLPEGHREGDDEGDDGASPLVQVQQPQPSRSPTPAGRRNGVLPDQVGAFMSASRRVRYRWNTHGCRPRWPIRRPRDLVPGLEENESAGTLGCPARTTVATIDPGGVEGPTSILPTALDCSVSVVSINPTPAFPSVSNPRCRPRWSPPGSATARWPDAETATSTPHRSVEQPWFSASLTRATTQGTSKCRLANKEITRLTWSCAGHGGEHVGLQRPGLLEHDRVGGSPPSTRALHAPRRRSATARSALDQGHLVVGQGQGAGHLLAQAPGADNDDPQCPNSLLRKLRSRPSDVDATTKLTRSPA